MAKFTMRALALESFDGPPVVTDVPVPLPGPGETSSPWPPHP